MNMLINLISDTQVHSVLFWIVKLKTRIIHRQLTTTDQRLLRDRWWNSHMNFDFVNNISTGNRYQSSNDDHAIERDTHTHKDYKYSNFVNILILFATAFAIVCRSFKWDNESVHISLFRTTKLLDDNCRQRKWRERERRKVTKGLQEKEHLLLAMTRQTRWYLLFVGSFVCLFVCSFVGSFVVCLCVYILFIIIYSACKSDNKTKQFDRQQPLPTSLSLKWLMAE